jgi:hypothetical protein
MIEHRGFIPYFNSFKPKPSFLFWNTKFTPSHLSMRLSVPSTPKKSIEFLLNQLDHFLRQDKDFSPKNLHAYEDRRNQLKLASKRKFFDKPRIYLAVILFTTESQLIDVSLLVMRGTPRYLTGRVPFGMCRMSKIFCFTSSATPARKMELLEGLAFKPERCSNSARAPIMVVTEETVATEKTNKSSAKHRLVKLTAAHFGW